LWCIKTQTLIRTFFGSVHNEYVISSTFGGVSGDFIASGSEDESIVIWNRKNENPIHKLIGHIGTVNAVSWNPVHHEMLASGGDDGTIRIWLPEGCSSRHI
jgi:WD40 repeat protein